MSIFLITGIPGAGKTHFMVKKLRDELLPTGRPIVANIAGLNMPGVDCHPPYTDLPHEWENYADGTIFIFDEVHRQWPALRGQKVPPSVAALDTHRHRGFDFYLLTQSPGKLDKQAREMVEEHTHLRRLFGATRRSKIERYPGTNLEPSPNFTHEDADTGVHILSPDVFPLYTSASQHNMRVRVPRQLLVWGSVAVVMVGLTAWLAWSNFGPGSVFWDRFAAAAMEGTLEAEAALVGGSHPEAYSCALVASSAPLTVRLDGRAVRIDPDTPGLRVRWFGSRPGICLPKPLDAL